MKNIKIIISLVLSIFLVLSLTSCSSTVKDYNNIVEEANKNFYYNSKNTYNIENSDTDTEEADEFTYVEEKFELTSLESKIADKCQKYMEDIDFQGCVLLGIGDKIIFKNAYGYANEKEKLNNQNDTVFQIASLTKQFTAAGILLLQEQGKLSVTDKLSKYFPGFIHGDKLTVENLLFMTSGLQDFADSFILDNQKANKEYKVGYFYDLIKDFQLYFAPGSYYEYCNTNYYMLGMIIEKASGMTYEDYLRKNIFEPLNMTMTDFDNSKVTCKSYTWGKENKTIYDKSVFYASGSICSTTEDMFRWLRGFNSGKVVNEKTLKYIRANKSKLGYSCGWTVSDKTNQHHSGNLSAFRSYDEISYKNDVKVVVLSNNEQVNPSYIGNALIDIANKNLN